MKYTFLLPAYKSKYLEIALQSILSQTYKDFMVLVSDDCSPEDIYGIVSKFHNERIKYRRNDINIGGVNLVDHWNLLIHEVETDYLIMASDDDVYEPNFLEEVEKLTLKYPEVNLFRPRVRRIDANGEPTAEDDLYEEYVPNLKAVYNLYCTNYIGCIANYVFRTDTLKEKGCFIKFPFAWFSDLTTVIASTDKGLVNTKDILFSFRLSQTNISDIGKNKQVEIGKLNATILFDGWMTHYVDNMKFVDTPLNHNMHKRIIHNYKQVIYSHCGDYSWAVSLFELMKIYNKIKNNNHFSKFTFLKDYILAVIARKFGRFL